MASKNESLVERYTETVSKRTKFVEIAIMTVRIAQLDCYIGKCLFRQIFICGGVRIEVFAGSLAFEVF